MTLAPLVVALLAELAPAQPQPVPIVGGAPTTDPEFDGVVALLLPGDRSCSGILVAPRLVMTAAHCVAELGGSDQIRVAYGDDAFGPSVVSTQWGYDVSRYCPTCQEDRYDVAWVELDQDAGATSSFPRPVAVQDEWDEAMASGTAITVVGFGATAAGGDSDGIKRAVSVEITKLSRAGIEFYAGGDGRDSCDGDSGGPALTRLADGTLRLLGLTSRGPENCGVGGIYATAYPQLCTMREQTGVDLTAPGCDQCDCVDFVDDDSGGCAVAGRGAGSVLAWLAVVLAIGARHRRASPTRTCDA